MKNNLNDSNLSATQDQAREIYYVTGNTGKFEEVRDFVAQYTSKIIIKQYHVDLFEAQTLDQKSIATSKASQAWDLLQKPLLVDDSGIYFKKYNQFPGTLTKYVYLGIGFEGILRLVSDDPRAVFLLNLVFVDGPAPENYHYFLGRCDGTIVAPRDVRSHPELPYDEVFLPDGSPGGRTYAQLRGRPEMAQFAYRLKAMKSFIDWFLADRA